MASLSVRAAAEQARTSDRTVRRWIAENKLPATRTADGWTVDADDLAALLDGRTSANGRAAGPTSDVQGSDGHVDGRPRGRPSDEAPYLAELVRDLQRQNLELAGLVGSLQQRLVFADDRIRALEAPKEPASSASPFLRDSEGVAVEPPHTSAATRNGRPWWRLW